MVYISSYFFWRKNVNLEMLKSGMACVFKSKYTSFGKLEQKFLKAESKAKSKKLGIWSDPNFILPQEYKNQSKIFNS